MNRTVGTVGAFAVLTFGALTSDVDLILATDALDVDFDVQLAHTGDDGFASLFVV